MARISRALRSYLENSRAIRRSHNNPLKMVENLARKDELEKQFYDREAEECLTRFDDERFLYDETEDMPLSHLHLYSLLKDVSGKKVLDCCCGYGITSVRCAKSGASVTGIDISPRMIDVARKNAELNDVSDNINLAVMSVQDMKFDNNTFDYVVGLGALHHLNLDLSGREISRVLKDGGTAIFLEPRIPFQWLIFLRSLFPTKCLESPGGGQLSDKEVRVFSRHFSSHTADYFLLLRKLERFPILRKVSSTFDRFDGLLLDAFPGLKQPGLKQLCWAFVLQFRK
jgi:ubiquinone/menaquinone biosynthesis C-methylase UbiE